MKKILAGVVLFVVLLSGCGAVAGGDVKSPGDAREKLVEAWNCMVDFSWYPGTGKGATGKTIDLDLTIKQLDEKMLGVTEADEYMAGLDDEQYGTMKEYWSKSVEQLNLLYNQVKTNPPSADDPNYTFDTGLFEQYRDAFEAELQK